MCARNRLLTYVPHSGLGNQMISLLNALALAQNLSRALVLPPLLRHFDLSKGKCPDRLVPASQLRSKANALASRRPSVATILDPSSFGKVATRSKWWQQQVTTRSKSSACAVRAVDSACLDDARLQSHLRLWRATSATILSFGTLYALRRGDAPLAPQILTPADCLAYRLPLLQQAQAAVRAWRRGGAFAALHVRTFTREADPRKYNWRARLADTMRRVAADGLWVGRVELNTDYTSRRLTT